jgi:hypothetical protein
MEVKLGLSRYEKKHRLRVSRRIPEAMKKELTRGFKTVLFISVIIRMTDWRMRWGENIVHTVVGWKTWREETIQKMQTYSQITAERCISHSIAAAPPISRGSGPGIILVMKVNHTVLGVTFEVTVLLVVCVYSLTDILLWSFEQHKIHTWPPSVHALYNRSCLILLSFCYEQILVTWMFMHLTSIMFSMLGFVLCSVSNILIAI